MADRITKQFGKIKFEAFFDRPGVERSLNRKNRTVLAKSGGFARKVIRQSMKKAGKPGGKAHTSKPGEPPRWHNRKLKDRVLFFYEIKDREVVIGPMPYANKARVKHDKASGAQLLEEGGNFTLNVASRWLTKKARARRARMRKRPFIAPAMPKAIKNFKQLLAETPLR